MTFEGWREAPDLLFINTAAFSQPANRTFGTLERNVIRGRYVKNLDFGLLKAFRLRGNHMRVDLKFDFSTCSTGRTSRCPTASVSAPTRRPSR